MASMFGLQLKPVRPLDWALVVGAATLGALLSALIAWLTGRFVVLTAMGLSMGFGFGQFASSAGVVFGRSPRETVAFLAGLVAVAAIAYGMWALFGAPL